MPHISTTLAWRCLLAAITTQTGSAALATHHRPATAGLTWPNAESSTNGDAWLRENHDRIELLEPRVLILHANNKATAADSEAFAVNRVFPALAEGSRYHGYKDSSAKPQLRYKLVKVIDLTDSSGKDWPAIWPVVHGKFYYAGLFDPEFTKAMNFKDPKNPSNILSLCELFERGIVNEVWTQAPRDANGNPLGVYESKARVMIYDKNLKPTGKFDACAGNACFDPGPYGKCKVSIRLGELAIDRGPGCLTHGTGHGLESLQRVIPYYAGVAARFWNFDLMSRYKLPMDTQYAKCPYKFDDDCWTYPTHGSLSRGGMAQVPDFKHQKWGEGCGNVHFPPNGRRHYDYDNLRKVYSTCEDYGLRNGIGTEDKQTLYDSQNPKINEYDKKYDDCGGGWQIYLRQSIPGYGNKATGDDGKPMKSWWPLWYY